MVHQLLDVAAGLSAVGGAIADGADPRQLNKDLLGYLRGLLLIKTTDRGPSDLTEEQQLEMAHQAGHFSLDRLVHTIKVFSQAALDLKTATQPQLPLELALVEALLCAETDSATDQAPSAEPDGKPQARAEQPRKVPRAESPSSPTAARPSPEDAPEKETLAENQPSVLKEGAPEGLAGLLDAWGDVVTSVNQSNKHIAAIVRDCPPVAVEGDVVTLRARSPFHKEKLETDRAKTLVAQAISETLGRQFRVRCMLTQEAPTENPDKKDLQRLAEDPMIKAALDRGGEIGTVQ